MAHTEGRLADAMSLTGDACGGSQQISHAQHSRSLSALVGENCDFRKIYWFVHIARFFERTSYEQESNHRC
jgi:hypothetical protein